MSEESTRRFTVSLPAPLLDELDRRIIRQGYGSRSELVRDLIRGQLVQDSWEREGGEVHGVLTICYDHHRRDLVTECRFQRRDAAIGGLVHGVAHAGPLGLDVGDFDDPDAQVDLFFPARREQLIIHA